VPIKSAFSLVPVVLVVMVCVMAFLDLNQSAQEFYLRSLSDCLHLPVFALLSFSFFSAQMLSGRHKGKEALVTVLLSSFVGSSIELVQPMFERVASWMDVLYNLSGVFIGLFIAALVWKKLEGKQMVAWLAVVSILVLSLKPAVEDWLGYQRKAKMFPVLGGEFAPEDGLYWRATKRLKKPLVVQDGNLRLVFSDYNFSGVEYLNLRKDWSDWSKLKVEYFSPDSGPRKLHFRLDDADSGSAFKSRFNKIFELQEGEGSLEIDLEETGRDLSSITRFVLFTAPLKPSLSGEQSGSESRKLYLKRAYLLASRERPK